MNERMQQDFVDRVRAAHGANLVSVILYGGEGGRIRNILVVLDRITPADLRAEQEAVAAWIEAGNPPPVYFSASEIAGAGDVFPIEFLDMMVNRRVLAGRDVLAGLEISTRNLRHQLEYELRGKLIRLRRLYVPASADAGRLSSLLVESLSTFTKLFKFALRVVAGVAAPEGDREVVRAAAMQFGVDEAPFESILDARASGKPLREVDAHAVFGNYIEQIERVIEAVNAAPEH